MPASEATAPANPLVSALLTGTAPRPLKLSAARGVLPLSRAETLRILVKLLGDVDAEVARSAGSTLAATPEEEILPVLADPATRPEVLDHFGKAEPMRESVRTAVLTHPATSDDTIRKMAPSLTAALIDQLLLNQTRLISTPDLLDLVTANQASTPLQRVRVQEMKRHFLGVGLAPPEPEAPRTQAPPPPLAPETVAGAPAAADAGQAVLAPEGETAEPAQADSAIDNAMMKVMRLNTAEKIQLAFRGTREERSILIKDSSKSVQEAVLQSPKLTENEIEGIAKMRSVGEEVLRQIAVHRDWMKNYVVVHSLATNPKTPVGIAMNLISRLTTRDIKILCTDKNVPDAIRRQARKVNEARAAGQRQPRG